MYADQLPIFEPQLSQTSGSTVSGSCAKWPVRTLSVGSRRVIMLKASLLSLTVFVAFAAASPAHARRADEWSSVQKTTKHHGHVRHRGAGAGYTGRQTGEDVCRGDAVRLCKPVLGQGNMAVLGCFRQRARSLSRGCRALLQSYGQL